jgi:peptidoglycan/LPS O-acetylase OafA/YrhL
MSANFTPALHYRPDIDGLRALAVLSVVLFHAGLGCPGGYIGVDIFFVISGFLITSIIQKKLQDGTFVMSHFWEKRIRRIMPALTVVIFFIIAAAAFSFYPTTFEDFGKELIAQSTLTSNFYFWQQDGYFAAPSESQALLHTWSLAVEEQFYFVFPIILTWLFARKNSSLKKTLISISVILVASFTWSCIGVYKYPAATFFLLPARAWEMMLGAFIALYKPAKAWGYKKCSFISWAALMTIALCIYQYDALVTFPGIAALPPCIAAAALIFCNQKSLTAPAKLLSLRPFVFVGKISYSFYLWHWPFIVFANYTAVDTLSASTRWEIVCGSFIIAILSWKFVENPCRSDKVFSRKQVLLGFYIITLLFITSGLVIYKGKGWEQRFSNTVLEQAKSGDQYIKIKTLQHLRSTGSPPTIPFEFSKDTTLPILLWGDSHATYTIPAFEYLCEQYSASVYVATRAGVPPILGCSRKSRVDMYEYNNSVLKFIEDEKINNVVLVCRWSAYALGDGKRKTPSLIDADNSELSSQAVFSSRLAETVQRLNDLGVHVWILKQVPEQEIDPPRIIANSIRFNHFYSERGIPLAHHTKRQNFVNSVIEMLASDQVTVLDPTNTFLSKKEVCLFSLDGKSLYRDHNHLSRYGAEQIAPLFNACFKKNFHSFNSTE